MAINYNGTTLTNLTMNGTTIGKVIYNGVTVYLSSLTQPNITRGVTGQTTVAWTVTNASSETVTVYTRVDGYSWQNATNITSGSTTSTFNQSGLSAGTSYTINAYVEVPSLQTSATTNHTFTTNPMSVAATPSIVSVSQTPTRIYWYVRNNDTDYANTVHTYHKSNTGTYTFQYDSASGSGGLTGQFTQSYSPNTSYELGAKVSVSGKTDSTYGTYTNTTPALNPPTLTLTKMSSNTIKATWNSVPYVGSYRVQIRNTVGSYPGSGRRMAKLR